MVEYSVCWRTSRAAGRKNCGDRARGSVQVKILEEQPGRAVNEYRKGKFLISTDREKLNLDTVYNFLTESYWAKGIPREVVVRSIQSSLCFGVFSGSEQVGFARVVSDYATYAYLGDVFIIEPYRGNGLA